MSKNNLFVNINSNTIVVPHNLKKAVDEIYENFSDKNFTIQHLCDKLDMSYNHINNLCWENLNMCPSIILENTRLENTLKLIIDGCLTVKILSKKSGFSSSRTFRNVFKKKFGICATGCIENILNSKDSVGYVSQLLKQMWGREN